MQPIQNIDYGTGSSVGTWTLVGTQTGTASIAVPSGSTEITVIVTYGNQNYSMFAVVASLGSGNLVTGFSKDSSNQAAVIVTASQSAVNISNVYIGGSDVSSSCTLALYAR